jgi:O-acetyl-ADP-ribose deacetylase (regulator of RNase III)
MYKEIKGDLINLAKKGEFNVIAHGCNCQSNMGAGIAPLMAKAFGCDKFEMETWGPTAHKLGNIDYETIVLGKNSTWSTLDFKNNANDPEVIVVNAYTQNHYGFRDGPPLDYEALALCLRKMNIQFKGKTIGLPQIGCGLAGGDWSRVKTMIINELRDCDVVVVIFDKK